jgi:hypothetical protein
MLARLIRLWRALNQTVRLAGVKSEASSTQADGGIRPAMDVGMRPANSP